jgi:hypothetical protein
MSIRPLKHPDRICTCGCGRGIGYVRAQPAYHPACAKRLGITQHAPKREKAYEQKSQPYSHITGGRFTDPNRRQKPCKVCFGMPWARLQTRLGDHEAVADRSGRCRGCRELYAPEPRPEPCSVIGSSAAMAVREGQLHGMTHQQTGKPKAERASRAKSPVG